MVRCHSLWVGIQWPQCARMISSLCRCSTSSATRDWIICYSARKSEPSLFATNTWRGSSEAHEKHMATPNLSAEENGSAPWDEGCAFVIECFAANGTAMFDCKKPVIASYEPVQCPSTDLCYAVKLWWRGWAHAAASLLQWSKVVALIPELSLCLLWLYLFWLTLTEFFQLERIFSANITMQDCSHMLIFESHGLFLF